MAMHLDTAAKMQWDRKWVEIGWIGCDCLGGGINVNNDIGNLMQSMAKPSWIWAQMNDSSRRISGYLIDFSKNIWNSSRPIASWPTGIRKFTFLRAENLDIRAKFQTHAPIMLSSEWNGAIELHWTDPNPVLAKILMSDKDFLPNTFISGLRRWLFDISRTTWYGLSANLREIIEEQFRNVSERYRCWIFSRSRKINFESKLINVSLPVRPQSTYLPSIVHAIRATATFFQLTSNCLHRNGRVDAWPPNKLHPLLICSMFPRNLSDCCGGWCRTPLSAASK